MNVLLFIIRRLAWSVPTLVFILIGLFFLLKIAPGDTVDALLAQMGGGDAAMSAQLREHYGLDASYLTQLWNYLSHLVRLDLGVSAIYGKPVVEVILERLPATLLLMLSALSLSFCLGMILGVVAARRVNAWQDTLISTLGLIFYATPSFWFGLMSIILFSIQLEWLPAGGWGDIAADYTGWTYVWDISTYLVLPTLTLALGFLAIYLRIMRASMLEVLSLDFIRTARAKGVAEYKIIRRHVLRNALLPMVTMIGLQAGTLLGGSVVVESVFSLPGLGRLAYESVVQRDLNMLLGIVFVSSVLVVMINLVVDVLYTQLDPRIQQFS